MTTCNRIIACISADPLCVGSKRRRACRAQAATGAPEAAARPAL